MKRVKIYDDGGKTIDHYTLITPDGSVYGFNSAPYHPQGFGQYCGDFGNELANYRHLGKPIKLEDLSEDAKRFVTERLK